MFFSDSRSPWKGQDLATGSLVQAAFGVGGLVLVAFGAALPAAIGGWAPTILLLPTGALICGGVGLLQRDRERSPRVVTGMILVVAGVMAIAALSLLTADHFAGLRVDGEQRRFRMPIWHELLRLHMAWMVAAVSTALGVRFIAKEQVERDLAVGLALFCVFPLVGLFAYVLDLVRH